METVVKTKKDVTSKKDLESYLNYTLPGLDWEAIKVARKGAQWAPTSELNNTYRAPYSTILKVMVENGLGTGTTYAEFEVTHKAMSEGYVLHNYSRQYGVYMLWDVSKVGPLLEAGIDRTEEIANLVRAVDMHINKANQALDSGNLWSAGHSIACAVRGIPKSLMSQVFTEADLYRNLLAIYRVSPQLMLYPLIGNNLFDIDT